MALRIVLGLVYIVGLLGALEMTAQQITLQRFENNPIIHSEMLSALEGDNINGPTLIKVPSWVKNPLGKYYLYFAHHKGKYIRLAYADNLTGPWKIYKPGTLQLQECKCKESSLPSEESIRHAGAENSGDQVQHVASPDMYINDEKQELWLYYHCPLEHNGKAGQYTLSATSKDGIHFKSVDQVLGESYFRVFTWNDTFYAIGRSSALYRSANGLTAFEKGPNPFAKLENPSRIRHTAVKVVGNTLWVFFSRVGDTPEHILATTIPLNDDWHTWTPTEYISVAYPETIYEGSDLPIEKSQIGLYYGRVRQLRDPYIYEENNTFYLVYTTAGENAIAIGTLNFNQESSCEQTIDLMKQRRAGSVKQ
jgi:hypothetical protein